VIWWVVGAIGLLGLVLLGLAARTVLLRLPALRRAMARLEQRAAQAQALQASVEALQERMVGLQEQAETVRTGVATIRPEQQDHRRRT
jgi:hypothetical protein